MAKKKPITPKSQIKNVLRGMIWLRSRERQEAVKLKKNTCEKCDKKGSVAKGKVCKIQVHHKNLINWEKIFRVIYKELLVAVKYLEVLCVECHKEETKEQRRKK